MPTRTVSVRTALLALTLGASAGVQAALVGRLADGGGHYQAVYDTDLNITWLADANYAATSGYDADGRMGWMAAQDWIGTLNMAGYLGVGDWRLPLSDGCISYNCTGSELGYLFYEELGGFAGYGDPMPPLADADLALFSNLPMGTFWSVTDYLSDTAWAFEFGPYDVGRQIYFPKRTEFYAWAVRSGDIGAVPVVSMAALAVPLPTALGLFASGLIGIVTLARRRSV